MGDARRSRQRQKKKGCGREKGRGGRRGTRGAAVSVRKKKNVGRSGRARGGRRGRRGTRSTAVSVRWGWEGEGGRYQKARGGGGTLG